MFSIGDKVERIEGTYRGMSVGNVDTVIGFTSMGSLRLKNYDGGHDGRKFKRVEDNTEERIKKLEKELHALKNKSKLKEGDWFAVDVKKEHVWIGRVGNSYEYTDGSFWTYDKTFPDKHGRKATKQEIEQALITEAKRRGFVKGATFTQYEDYDGHTITSDPYMDEQGDLIVKTNDIGTLWIYTENPDLGDYGDWAKLIDNALTIFGYDVKEFENKTKIGCTTRPNEFWEDVDKLLYSLDADVTVKEIREELSKLSYISHDLPF